MVVFIIERYANKLYITLSSLIYTFLLVFTHMTIDAWVCGRGCVNGGCDIYDKSH